MTQRIPVRLRRGALHSLAGQFPAEFPVLLDSAADGALSMFSVLAALPGESLWLDGAGTLHPPASPGAIAGEGFLDAWQAWFRKERQASTGDDPAADLPFRGGWMFYLSYEMAQEVEPRLRGRMPTGPSLRALALRVPAAIVQRHDGAAWVVAEEGVPAADIDKLVARVESWTPAAAEERVAPGVPVEEDPAAYLQRVLLAQEHIRSGDIYQANLSRNWDLALPAGIPTASLYASLRRANPAPFAALLQFRDLTVLSSSPERLARLQVGGRVDTRPIAGTHPRGATSEADAALAKALIDHPKERAEHVMLIDLERNDLGRVCVGGSVHVDEYMGVETYAHVHHIVSNVTGRLRPDRDFIDLLRAVFPGGTITGCPKLRCMEIIAALEQAPRGAYTGSLGYLNRDGSGDSNILIRTMMRDADGLHFRAGAGIVADSDPQRELQETRNKARGMILALAPQPR
ncbi:MAG: hypothetical protein RL026_2632 [Pseudomonadota bacterium]|jgi:anthranilate synthase component 1